MDLIRMSQRDLTRIAVLSEVLAGQRTVVAAASVLDISVRQAFRLLARYQELGGAGLAHKARGRDSNSLQCRRSRNGKGEAQRRSAQAKHGRLGRPLDARGGRSP
jgi:transposase